MLKACGPAPAYERRLLSFDCADPFGLDEQLHEDERMVRDTAEGDARESLSMAGGGRLHTGRLRVSCAR
jgi:glutaryl-CoA dehydrogenase